MLMVDVDIGLRKDTPTPIIQVGLVDCWVYMFMVIIEVDIGLIPATLINITITENKFPTQGSFKMLFLGVCEDKTLKNAHQVC